MNTYLPGGVELKLGVKSQGTKSQIQEDYLLRNDSESFFVASVKGTVGFRDGFDWRERNIVEEERRAIHVSNRFLARYVQSIPKPCRTNNGF
jgi:hypothetical protein